MNPNIPDIGQSAPDFEVLNSSGDLFSLKQVLSTGANILLLFYRGHW
jgi:peroxiredoxin